MSLLVLRRAAALSRMPWANMVQTHMMATAPASEDPFMAIFKKQQETYRKLLEKTEGLTVPKKTDKKGIQEFAAKLAGIRKELGLYWTPENYKLQVFAEMEKLKGETDGTMRDMVSKAHTIGVDKSLQKSLLAALDEVEAKLGRPMLVSGDKDAQPLYTAAVEKVKAEFGYDKISDKDLLSMGDYDTAETIVKDLQEMSPQEFFERYTSK